jgi:glycogen operon protein
MLGPTGEKLIDDNFYLIFNAHYEPIDFVLPTARYGKEWYIILNTAENYINDDCTSDQCKPGETIKVESRSLLLLKNPR